MEKRPFSFAPPNFMSKRNNSMDASIPTVTLSDCGSYTGTEMTTSPENSKVDCGKVEGFTDADICAPQQNVFQQKFSPHVTLFNRSQCSSPSPAPRFPFTPRRAEIKNLVTTTEDRISHSPQNHVDAGNQRHFLRPPTTPSRFTGRSSSTSATAPVFPFTPTRKTQIQNSAAELSKERSPNRLFSYADGIQTQQIAPPTTPSRFALSSRSPFSTAKSGIFFTPKRTPKPNYNAEINAAESQITSKYQSHDGSQTHAPVQWTFHENNFFSQDANNQVHFFLEQF